MIETGSRSFGGGYCLLNHVSILYNRTGSLLALPLILTNFTFAYVVSPAFWIGSLGFEAALIAARPSHERDREGGKVVD